MKLKKPLITREMKTNLVNRELSIVRTNPQNPFSLRKNCKKMKGGKI